MGTLSTTEVLGNQMQNPKPGRNVTKRYIQFPRIVAARKGGLGGIPAPQFSGGGRIGGSLRLLAGLVAATRQPGFFIRRTGY
jgi:hypothetical protein